MRKKIILSGVAGGVAMSVWTFVANVLFKFASRMNMKVLPNEPQVYDLLKTSVTEPGRYIVNPAVNPQVGYPAGEPVFSLFYSGVGHESAGPLMWLSLVVVFGSTVLAAWMLSRTSRDYRSSSMRRVVFFTVVGVLFAVAIDLNSFGIGGRPMSDALLLGLHRILMWTFVGLVAAWFMKPDVVSADG